MASTTVTLVASNYSDMTNMSASSGNPVSYGYTDTSSSTYALLSINQNATGYLYYLFDTSEIPAGVTINSITAKAKLRVSSTTRVTNTVCQLYSGTTAKGSNTTFATTTTTTYNLSPGTGWTRNDLNDLRVRIGGTGSNSTNSKQIRVYGIEITITYELADVHVTGVSLPGTATTGAQSTTTLTPTITPSNASDQRVTWASSDTDVAVVNGGTVWGVAEGTATITVTTVDGGFTASCAVTVTASTAQAYMIKIGSYVLSIEESEDVYVNAAGTYHYYGLSGVEYSESMVVTNDVLWWLEAVTGGYHIRSYDGKYLNATYLQSSSGYDGTVKLDNTSDVWTISGTLANWISSGSVLHSTNANKNMTHEETSEYDQTPVNLFTVRTTGETSYAIEAAPSSGGVPVITVGTPSRGTISDETGYDQCICTFSSTVALQQWEVRATREGVTPGRGIGLLVESGTTLAAGASATIYIDNEELTQGDGLYLISVYGQSTSGDWSDEDGISDAFIPSGATALITSNSLRFLVMKEVVS